MNEILILLYIILSFIALAFAEGYSEGRYGWAERSYGWKLKIFKRILTAYHFWLWLIMLPLLLMFPIFIYGFNLKLFGIILAGYIFGSLINDFAWYIVNPKVTLKDFNPRFAKWYNWWNIFGIKIPDFYIFYPIIGLIIWILFVV
jgi:hypothetical protein